MSVNKSRLQLLVPIIAVFFAVACTDPVTGPGRSPRPGPGDTPFATPDEDCGPLLDEPDNRWSWAFGWTGARYRGGEEERCTVY